VSLDFLMADIPEPERAARMCEMRALAAVYCGSRHPVTEALRAAIADPGATGQALRQLDGLPALRRRRLLSAYGALHA
jgi:hypothetical protein